MHLFHKFLIISYDFSWFLLKFIHMFSVFHHEVSLVVIFIIVIIIFSPPFPSVVYFCNLSLLLFSLLSFLSLYHILSLPPFITVCILLFIIQRAAAKPSPSLPYRVTSQPANQLISHRLLLLLFFFFTFSVINGR